MPNLATQLTNITNPNIGSIGRSAIRQFDNDISDIPDILKLTLGEPDLDTPEHIKQALKTAIDQNQSHYAPSAGTIELRVAIANYLKNKVQVDYDPQSEVIVTVGATEAIFASMATVLSPGDEVLIPTPTFPLYFAIAKSIGAVPVEINTAKDNFVLTPEKLKQTVNQHPTAKMLVLNYPSNPTGATYTQAELAALSTEVQQANLLVLADEIYCELTYGVDHHSIAQLLPERTILINGVSKTYAMTGYRIGYLVAPADLTRDILKMHGFAVTTTPTTIMTAAAEALNHGQQDVIEMQHIYQQRRDFLTTELTRLNFIPVNPKGAFYLFAKIPANLTQDSMALALDLAQKGHLGIIPGVVFGAGGEGYLRFSYAAAQSTLQTAVNRLENYLGEIK